MSDEKNENRINIEDLPQAEQELTAEEAKDVKGGSGSAVWTGTVRLESNASTSQATDNVWRGPVTL